MYLVALLEKEGYTCIPARNGSEAVEAFRGGGISAVLIDFRMPIMDGLEAVREIRRLEATEEGHVPIIMLTAYDEERDLEASRAAGADRVLRKPFSEIGLVEMVAHAVSGGRTGKFD